MSVQIKKLAVQEVFSFAPNHNYSDLDLLIDDSNRTAISAILSPTWPAKVINLHGEHGSGKTHLAQIAQQHFGAQLEIIEDVNNLTDQENLLHEINFLAEKQRLALITSSIALNHIGFTLPDLTSRIATFFYVEISPPSEQLQYALLAKQFAARQIAVDDNVLNFLAQRLQRSYTKIAEIVTKIDRLSLQEKRNITIPLVKEILGQADAC